MNKIIKTSAIAVMTCMASMVCIAADEGSGLIRFNGSIIEAACSVNPESSQQEIELGQISTGSLADNGISNPRNFLIKLENCSLSAADSVTVTFGGAAADDTNKLLGITGSASGAGIALVDGAGKQITLGVPTDARELLEGNNTLNFSTYLQGLGSVITTGDFTSVADFKLTYL